MATIKIKFRKSSIKGKAGTIYYQICHKQNNKSITTKIHILPYQWNSEKEQLNITPEEEAVLRKYQRQIDNDIALLKRIIKELDKRGGKYSLSDIVSLFHSPGTQTTIMPYIRELIAQLKEAKKFGTARNYQRTLNSFSAFLENTDYSFALFNEKLIQEYNNWLQSRDIVRNTVSFYMRILRSIYNKASHQHIVEQSFPFQNVYTGIDRTRKRAIDEDTILRLLKQDLSFSPSLSFARDLFIFSYCARGMAFVDIAFLRKQDIHNGTISYTRRKTGQRLIIRLEPCMDNILKRYAGTTKSSWYVFPLLSSENPEIAFKQYQTALGLYNRQLKKISNLMGLDTLLSSYTARHTWATVARNHHVPISVISAGMGHSSEKTTQIYLASLENSIIDNANRDLLAALNINPDDNISI